MSLLSLHEDRAYAADWSLPGSSQTISGQLNYTSQRAELNLNHAFSPLRGTISVSDTKPIYSAVHGVSSKGEALSVLKAQSISISFNFSSGGVRQPERLISSWVVVGAHVTAETLYSSVRFFIPGLEAWLSKPAIAESLKHDSPSGLFTTTFVVRPPETETTPVTAIDATLEWGVSATMSSNPFKSIAVDVRGWVILRPQSPRPLEWFLDEQTKLATLLAFMAGLPMPVDAIQASVGDSIPPLSVLVTLRQAQQCSFKSPHDYFVSRGALGSSFPSLIANWFREVESVLVPSQLALGVLSTKNLWLHIEFLSLIQALEGFHRARFPGIYMAESEYNSVKSALSAAIPTAITSDHRDALRSRIRYGNQISLSKRLNELRGCLGDQLAALIIASDGKVPRIWIDTRNYHSHWDEELRAHAIDGQEMYNANVRMEHFLRALYLLMAGVPQETLIRCLQNSSHTSQQLAQLNIVARRAVDPSAPTGVLMTVGDQVGPPNPSAETQASSDGG